MEQTYTNRSGRGLSLIELMVAMAIFAVALGGIMPMIVAAIESNNRNRRDGSSVGAAQTILETIAATAAGTNLTISTVTDCAGNALSINTSSGGAALNSATAAIDFTQATVSGYQANFASCAPAQELQATYDVRWNIQTVNQVAVSGTKYTISKLITVSARPLGSGGVRQNGYLFAPAVTLQAIVGD